jgi:hypothetical protein
MKKIKTSQKADCTKKHMTGGPVEIQIFSQWPCNKVHEFISVLYVEEPSCIGKGAPEVTDIVGNVAVKIVEI